MEAKASLKRIRMAPRKVRVILNAIREQPVELALAQLKMADRRAAKVVHKLLASAVTSTTALFRIFRILIQRLLIIKTICTHFPFNKFVLHTI